MTSTAVNRPTNIKQKEQDVNQKLQLYGIVTGFSNGKVPSNKQIDVALSSFQKQAFIAAPSKKLSADGQALVHDFSDVIEQAKILLLTKNEGNLLQDFIWQTQQIDGGNAAIPNAPVDKDTAKQHGNQALDGLRTLGTLLISNGQFRKLLQDASILLRDIAGDAAQKAATKVNPSQEQLSQIDAPAEDNTWHDVPDLSRDSIKNQLKQTYDKNSPLKKKDVQDAVGDSSAAAHPDGSRDPQDAAALAAQAQQTGGNSGVDAAGGVQAGLNTLKDRASTNIPDEHKDTLLTARDRAKERTKSYLSDKIPPERRDQSIFRLKKMIVEIQGHPDYLQAVDTLLELAETYAGHGSNVTQQAIGSAKGARADTSLQLAEKDLKTLIERFAYNTSTDGLWDSINQIYKDADKDPELKNWFKQIDAYIRKTLKQQGYILEDAATQEWNALYDKGNFLLRDRYRNHTDRIIDETKFLSDQFDKDPLNKSFAASCNKLFKDLGNDENGKPTFKPHLLKDLGEVILPAVFENIRYVPIPRIEFSDPQFDAIVENLIIEGDNLLPNAAELASDNYFRWGRKNISNLNNHKIMVSVTGIQMDLRDVSYHIKRKTGFPSITDTGVADIFLGGSGFSFKIKLATAESKDKQHFFKVELVHVDVKNFDIKLKKSSHKLLFGLVKPLMLRVLRPALQKVLEKVIKDKVTELDQLVYSIKLEADRALKEAQNDPDNVPNIYSRYANATKAKLAQGKKKVDDTTSQSKVNLAITQHDSIFPNVNLPGGISTKATEYKELAAKGDKWESPIFSIGSASTSAVPAAGKIEQKSRNGTATVNGPQNVGGVQGITDQLHDPAAVAAGQNGTATNGTNGFDKQVDQAFHNSPNGVAYV